MLWFFGGRRRSIEDLSQLALYKVCSNSFKEKRREREKTRQRLDLEIQGTSQCMRASQKHIYCCRCHCFIASSLQFHLTEDSRPKNLN